MDCSYTCSHHSFEKLQKKSDETLDIEIISSTDVIFLIKTQTVPHIQKKIYILYRKSILFTI